MLNGPFIYYIIPFKSVPRFLIISLMIMGYIFFLYRNMRDTGRIEQCFVSWLVKEGASHFSAR